MFLYGDSGTGKSSLVNAGLLPRAQELGLAPVRVRVQPRPSEELVIEPIVASDDGSEILPCILAPEMEPGSRAVLSVAEFQTRLRGTIACGSQPLIVFDQFEEILTLFEDGDASQTALVHMLELLLLDEAPMKLLFGFREDHLGRVKQLLGARPELVDQALRLAPPPADALDRIIRGPFERHPGHFEPVLDGELVERLQTALAKRFGTGEVSLSEVQTVCMRLWQSPNPHAALDAKGVQGLLEDELGEALDAFAPDVRAAAVAVLSEMVTSVGTRNVVSAEDLRARAHENDQSIKPALLDEALERLERDSRLVRRERRRDLDLYEITSEFLVPWISRRRQLLELARERRRGRRRLLVVAMVAATVALLALVIAAVIVGQRAEARRQAQHARSLALAASSVEPLASRPDIALGLAFEAYRTKERPEANAALVRALLAARRMRILSVLNVDLPRGVAFSPDGTTLATVGAGGVVLWNQTTHAQRVLSADSGAHTVSFSPDGRVLASAGYDRPVRLWDVATRKHIGRLSSHRGASDLAFSPAGGSLATANLDGTVRIWGTSTHRLLATLSGHRGAVLGVAFSPDGHALATAGRDRSIRIWSTDSHKQLARLTGHTGSVADVAFSPDGHMLASAGSDRTVRLWDIATRRQIDDLRDGSDAVSAVAFSPDGRTLAAVGNNKRVRLWDPIHHRLRARLEGHTGEVFGVAFSPDGRILATASHDGTVRFSSALPPSEKDRLIGPTGSVKALAFSPDDGRWLATAAGRGNVRLWNLATRKQRAHLSGLGSHADSLAFSPDGQMLATTHGGRAVNLSDPATGERLGRIVTPAHGTLAVTFSPDGRTLATGGFDGWPHLWDPATGQERAPFTGQRGATIGAIAISPDGRSIATASYDSTVRVWDIATRKIRARLSLGSSDHVRQVAFSPDGRTLATAGGTARLWDTATYRERGRLTGHTSWIWAVAFSPDGSTVATAGNDHTVRLWDLVTRIERARLTGHAGAVHALAFSPSGRTLVSGGGDRTVRIWTDVLSRNVNELRAVVCEILHFGLFKSDWERYAPGIPYQRTCG